MSIGQGVFVECESCGERWKVATLPMDARKFCNALKTQCPGCGERKRLYMSKVAKSRKGKLVSA
jgi:DNA-directed RNA polymerase subunit M/transcription elongation factor TFIIS